MTAVRFSKAHRTTILKLRMGDIVRRGDQWRFGCHPREIPQTIVDDLIAAGRARREGDRLIAMRRSDVEQ